MKCHLLLLSQLQAKWNNFKILITAPLKPAQFVAALKEGIC